MKDPIRCNEISHSKTLSDSFCPLLSIIERGLTVRPSTFPSTWILKLAPFLFIQFAVLKSDATLDLQVVNEMWTTTACVTLAEGNKLCYDCNLGSGYDVRTDAAMRVFLALCKTTGCRSVHRSV